MPLATDSKTRDPLEPDIEEDPEALADAGISDVPADVDTLDEVLPDVAEPELWEAPDEGEPEA